VLPCLKIRTGDYEGGEDGIEMLMDEEVNRNRDVRDFMLNVVQGYGKKISLRTGDSAITVGCKTELMPQRLPLREERIAKELILEDSQRQLLSYLDLYLVGGACGSDSICLL